MSGTGVQSAMRRRTRPPEDPRKSFSNENNTRQTNQVPNVATPVNNGTTRLNPTNILYSHELKLNSIEAKLKGLNIENIENKSATISDIKNEVEKNFENRLNIINNNLNYILNGFNEVKQSTKMLELEIARLTKENKDLANKKLDNNDFLEYKNHRDQENNKPLAETLTEASADEILAKKEDDIEKVQTDNNSEISLEKSVLTDTTDTIGTLESIDIKNSELLDERLQEKLQERLQEVSGDIDSVNDIVTENTDNIINLNNMNITNGLVKNLDLKIDDINSVNKESIEIVNKTNNKVNDKLKNKNKN